MTVGSGTPAVAAPLHEEHVVLLDPAGRPIGTEEKASVHTESTPLHLAFSLHLFGPDGRVLATRRALTKVTWPGVWTNSCCGHPGVEESLPAAVRRRARYELGVELTDLECVLPDFAYTATDASGIVENEICPVYASRLHPDSSIRPNSAEVMDWAWMEWVDLRSAITAAPFAFSPWAADQVHQLPHSPCP